MSNNIKKIFFIEKKGIFVMMQTVQEPLKVFISYSHKDKRLKDKLITHLNALIRQKYISLWYDNMILPGKEIDEEIRAALQSSQIVLLLLSADYLTSNYCYQEEMEEAMNLRKEKKLVVIPIMLREVDLTGTPIDKIMSLPEDRKAVTQFRNEDVAFKNVADGIRKVVEGWFRECTFGSETISKKSVSNKNKENNMPVTQNNYGFQFNGSTINGGSFEIKN